MARDTCLLNLALGCMVSIHFVDSRFVDYRFVDYRFVDSRFVDSRFVDFFFEFCASLSFRRLSGTSFFLLHVGYKFVNVRVIFSHFLAESIMPTLNGI